MAEADPQKTFNVHEAKTHLSKLIERAHAGEEIVLAKAGVPYAKIVRFADPAAAPAKPGRFAHLRGDLASDIWFEPLVATDLDAWEGRYSTVI